MPALLGWNTSVETTQKFNNMIWLQRDLSFVATGEQTTLAFLSATPNDNGYGPAIDGVWVTALPEPLSGVLTGTALLLGAAATALRRRSRKSSGSRL
jgi:hypothetical protein